MKKNYYLRFFLVCFILLELLWSPLLVFIFNFLIPNYYIRKTSFINFSPNIISLIYFIELIVLLGLIFFVIKIKPHKKMYVPSVVILFFLSIVCFFALFFSLGMRSIGF